MVLAHWFCKRWGSTLKSMRVTAAVSLFLKVYVRHKSEKSAKQIALKGATSRTQLRILVVHQSRGIVVPNASRRFEREPHAHFLGINEEPKSRYSITSKQKRHHHDPIKGSRVLGLAALIPCHQTPLSNAGSPTRHISYSPKLCVQVCTTPSPYTTAVEYDGRCGHVC